MLPSYQPRQYHTINMADINNKPKLQLRATPSFLGEKSPSPATKLLINHGKPNFTIQKTSKAENGNGPSNGTTNGNASPWTVKSPVAKSPVNASNNNNNNNNNSDEFVVKSTTFNGVLKPSSIVKTSQPNSLRNGQEDNEAAKVVLRRAKVAEPALREDEDENVPEFIRRQRRIQERLAKENVLDFENRRSGYFTHVMISPTSPNRQSFVQTMSSPAIVPSLEIPPPTKVEEEEEQQQQAVENREELVTATPVTLNGHDNGVEEEEVNKAIEEVNKAVAGEEEDDKPQQEEAKQVEEQKVSVEETKQESVEPQHEVQESVSKPEAVATSSPLAEEIPKQEEAPAQVAVVTSIPLDEEPHKEQEAPLQNGHVEAVVLTNGNAASDSEVTISHTNALSTPSIPAPDPSGEKGVNYEPKTVVSFSKDLGSDVNKYPDTVKVVKENGQSTPTEVDGELQELAKLKFEIKENAQDIEVTPVLKVE